MSIKQILFLIVFINFVSFGRTDKFPDNFLFGVATSAYQIEGAWNQSGKGESMWDWFTHNFPERIQDTSNADIACDSYNRYEEDVSFLKDLNVSFYRFSISWPRIFPNGQNNRVNWEGVNYYIAVFKLLKEFNIEPVVTLYHWDLPQPLNNLGGWTNPLLVDYFANYVRFCYEQFGQYVKYWITLNEPQTTCINGYSSTEFAPGYNIKGLGFYYCAYVHLLAHARAYHIYKDEFYETQQGKVSIDLTMRWMEPLNKSDESHVLAAERTLQFTMGLYGHPLYLGDWPQIVKDNVDKRSELQGYARSRLPKFTSEQIDFIKGTNDYFALNYYTSNLVYPTHDITEDLNETSYGKDMGVSLSIDSSWPSSTSSWLYNVPYGLRSMINWVAEQYDNPEIFILENGFADLHTLDDYDRINYLNGHLCHTLRAINEDKRTVIGYALWSLMDNFEWSDGYEQSFGIIAVDFSSVNLTRTVRASYEWYKNLIESRTIDCEDFE
ncbi:hypothetical protein ABEB36_003604 [Hypothenemus hampei]|uniref:beta-glucosidase n=1 Tax=Hypothenemus hampei TaxID=57062 RepID=A0ABD1F9Q0_HYPHA